MLIGFEHVGMIVSDLDRSLHFYRDLLGLEVKLRKRQADGGEVAFVDAGGGQLEMAEPAGSVKSPAARPGREAAGLLHITLAFDDVEATYARLIRAGIDGVEPPRAAFNSEMLEKVAFVRDPDGILVELAQRAKGR